jgi:hypothetical protein
MKKIFNKLMIIAILLMTVSCIDEITIDTPNTDNGEKSVNIRVAVPYTNPQTRTIGAEQENSIGTLTVLAFKVENDNTETFLYRSEARRDDSTEGSSLQSFNVKLLVKDHQQRFVLIANANDEINTLIGDDRSVWVGTKKEEMLADLTFALKGDRWNAVNTSNYTKIPMWGESDRVTISGNTNAISNNISLLRMVAKIDVQLESNLRNIFELTGVRLYNTNNKGFIVPFPENVENYKAKKASIPNDAVTNKNAILYNSAVDFTYVDGKAIAMRGAIYLFETAAKAMSNPNDQTSIVVSGKFMNGAETFYRLDFFNETGDSYLDILRNHKYTFNITDVKGHGYPTPEEAFELRPFNMNTEIFVTDENDMTDIVFNGQYMLGVNKSHFVLSHNVYNASTSGTDNLLKVTTDFPKGWTANVYTDQAGTTPMPANNWLSISPNAGAGGAQSNDVRIITTENKTETTRTAYIQLKAGLLSHTVVVVQFPDPNNIPDNGTPPEGINTYVGAFWRWNQTGERVVRLENMYQYTAYRGVWHATVSWYDDKWNPASGDGVVLTNGGSSDPSIYTDNPNNAENYQVTGGAIISGIVNAQNPDIIFRIGLQKNFSGYHEVDNPARYAVIQISYGNPAKVQKLFIRQGEGADAINGVKWSPYNVRENRNFVDYPTKAGFFYQWGHSTTSTTLRAYSPIGAGAISGWSGGNSTGFLYSLGNASPANYTLPTESQAQILLNANKNSFYGYYADGFFDRRKIVDGIGTDSGKEVCVSSSTDEIAYIGKLFFHPATNATLFLPSAGYRASADGSLRTAGRDGCYATATSEGNNNIHFINTWSTGMLVSRWPRNLGYNIRPVRQ